MTAQATELINIAGQTHPLCTAPLGPWLAEVQPALAFDVQWTSNWRGYVGHWSIEAAPQRDSLIGASLYLKGIRALARFTSDRDEVPRPVALADLFPGWPDGVLAHWFSGELRVIRSNVVKYKHSGWASLYEFEQFLSVDCGVVVGERFEHHLD